ncbi:MAG: flagella basal body P-ring formation protein FlgA [Acidobacteria bacterium]|nr:flagella basal body P-ring formation protein FlgA [Acidobacteriota bacterium]MBI3662988.1 flagella basal body P-ring formation protein FlgA [Acidobacteriota bacterium]
MRRHHIAIAVLLGAIGSGAAAWPAGSPSGRTPLREAVEVHSVTLHLSDLLPETAPLDLRALAAGISLGHAPQAGTRRSFERAELVGSLRDTPELLERLDLPVRVSVGRSHRLLSTEEVLRAIRDSLERNHLAGGVALSAADFEMPASVRVLQDDPGLRVTRIEYDPLLHRTKFRLWLAAERNILPFYVLSRTGLVFRDAADRDAVPEKTAAIVPQTRPLERRGLNDTTPPREAEVGAPVVVHPGKPVTLVLAGARVRIVTAGIPLQPGRLGETIRVRDASTKNVVLAVVLGPDSLRADF